MNYKAKPKRLLCIVGSMDAGGAETFLMKVYRSIDKNKYQMDFIVSTEKEGFYDKEILALGGKIYYSPPKSKKLISSLRTIRKIVRDGKYKHVMRISEHSLASLDLLAAKLGGANTLIFRSSNASTCGGKASKLFHKLFASLPRIVPTIKIAPSTEAAEHVFGKNAIKKDEALIIKNAISIDDFIFNEQKRDKIREELGIRDEFVVGHIGRFSNQKNHSFLIEVFAEIVKNHKNSILILVGKGELESSIKEKINKLGLQDKVIFTGIRSDVSDIMMAMDVFVFPSLFEGMPNVIIEAQATGLPCIISDTITKEANITGLVSYISLDESPAEWAKKAMAYAKKSSRKNMKEVFINKGYDIALESKRLMEIVFNDK